MAALVNPLRCKKRAAARARKCYVSNIRNRKSPVGPAKWTSSILLISRTQRMAGSVKLRCGVIEPDERPLWAVLVGGRMR